MANKSCRQSIRPVDSSALKMNQNSQRPVDSPIPLSTVAKDLKKLDLL